LTGGCKGAAGALFAESAPPPADARCRAQINLAAACMMLACACSCSGEVRVVGCTSADKYRKFIEKDPGLERRFQVGSMVLQHVSAEGAHEYMHAHEL
jgi:hypothetical protein